MPGFGFNLIQLTFFVLFCLFVSILRRIGKNKNLVHDFQDMYPTYDIQLLDLPTPEDKPTP